MRSQRTYYVKWSAKNQAWAVGYWGNKYEKFGRKGLAKKVARRRAKEYADRLSVNTAILKIYSQDNNLQDEHVYE